MSTSDRIDRAAALLERLLADPQLRVEFRRRPVTTCQAFDLPELAAELESGPPGAMTLEQRESRSSLAGVMISAAVEGLGLVELVAHHAAAFEEDVHVSVRKLVERVEDATTNDRDGASPTSQHGSATRAAVRSVSTGATTASPPISAELPAGLPTNGPPPGPAATDPASADESPAVPATPDRAVVDRIPEDHDTVAYPGDDAPQTQLASWMARRAGAADLPGPLPIMAALERSGLTNLPPEASGTAGFFGMSRATWSVGPYAGFAEDPDLQLTWFLDRAAVVKAEHVAAGDVDFGRDPGSWHEWITAALGDPTGDAQRGRAILGRARELLDSGASASVSHGRGSDAEMAGASLSVDGRAPVSSPAGRAVALARSYLGDPYRWGGAAPSTGFDCSGLVQYVYGRVGIELPRVTHQQFAVGQHITRDGLRTGDIVFFRDATGYIHHEGLYIGKGEFLHAPRTGDVIKVSSLSEPYYAGQFAGGRRVAELAEEVDSKVDMTRREGGSLGEPRAHDARVMPTISPSAAPPRK